MLPTHDSTSSAPTSVYLYYDVHQILIYVGITNTAVLRNRQHNSSKAWWPFVAEQKVEHFSLREEAHAREVHLIRTYRPPFNKQHNPQYAEIRDAYIRLQQAGPEAFDIKRLLHSKSNKNINLTPYCDDDDHLALITRVEDAPIAHCLRRTRDTKVFSARGEHLGRVDGAEFQHGRLRLTLKLRKEVPTIINAYGYVKVVRQQAPVELGFRSIALFWGGK